VFLKRLHPALWEHLQLSMIQPQLYAISWARLLFGRVYVVTNSVLFRLWDYIFESTEGEGAVLESGHVESDAARLSTNQLSPLTGYDIRQPLLMKLACFILSLVLEVRFLSLSLFVFLPLSLNLFPCLLPSLVLFQLRKGLLVSDEVTTLTILMRFTASRQFHCKDDDCPSEKICLAMVEHLNKVIKTARQLER
jgi:hypothetical protein